MDEPRTALIIVDVQNDFCPGGKLPVPNGDLVVPQINKVSAHARNQGWVVVASRDWHPKEAKGHFKGFGGIWPEHCVGQSDDPEDFMGAMFHPDLHIGISTHIFHKGMGKGGHGYSAFEGLMDLPERYGSSLERFLRVLRAQKLYICGLATDYCVKATALDAQKLGFETFLLTDAIAAVNIKPDDGQKAIDEMVAAGVNLTTVAEVCEA